MNGLVKQAIILVVAFGILLPMSACGDNHGITDNENNDYSDSLYDPDNSTTQENTYPEKTAPETSFPAEEKVAYYATEYNLLDADRRETGLQKNWYNVDGDLCLSVVYRLNGTIESILRYTYEYSNTGVVVKSIQTVETETYDTLLTCDYDDLGNLIGLYMERKNYEDSDEDGIFSFSETTQNDCYGVLSSKNSRIFRYDLNDYVLGYRDVSISSGKDVRSCELSYSADYRTASFEITNQVDELVYTGEIKFDEEHRVIYYHYLSPDGVETYSHESEYDEDGRLIHVKRTSFDEDFPYCYEYTYSYDEYGKLLEERFSNSFAPDEEPIVYYYVATAWVSEDQLPMHYASVPEVKFEKTNPADYYDFIICEGDGYRLIGKREETLMGIEDYFGVIDKDYNWVVPMSSNTFFNLEGEENGIWENTDFEEKCNAIAELTHYAGEGVFVIGEESGYYFNLSSRYNEQYYRYNGNYRTRLFNVETNTWLIPGQYESRQSFLFKDGVYVASDAGHPGDTYFKVDEHVKLFTPETVTQTDVFCKSSRYVGRYSEGLFFSYDGFYNLNGEMQINLSEYAGLIINQPYFENGTCMLIAENEIGTRFVAEIDSSGRYLTEFTKLD